MKEYEVVVESMNPCGGRATSTRDFFEVECESPEEYVKANAKYPITEIGEDANGNVIIHTGDGSGYVVNYYFNEI